MEGDEMQVRSSDLNQLYRTFGQMEGRMGAVESSLTEIKTGQNAITLTLSQMRVDMTKESTTASTSRRNLSSFGVFIEKTIQLTIAVIMAALALYGGFHALK